MGQLTYFISRYNLAGISESGVTSAPQLMSRIFENVSPTVINYRSQVARTGSFGYVYLDIGQTSSFNVDTLTATVKPEVVPPNFSSGDYLIFSDTPLSGTITPGLWSFSLPMYVSVGGSTLNGQGYQVHIRLYKFKAPRTFASFLSTYNDIGGALYSSQMFLNVPTSNGGNLDTQLTAPFQVDASLPQISMDNEYLAIAVGMSMNMLSPSSRFENIHRGDSYLRTPNFISAVDPSCAPLFAHGRESYSYIAPDGTEYPLDVPNQRIVMSSEGEGVPPINYLTQRGPFQHGDTVLDMFLQPRIVQLMIRHQLRSRNEYHSAREGLVSILSPLRQTVDSLREPGTLRKHLMDGTVRDIRAFILQGPNFNPRTSQWDEWAFQEALRFQADDPTYINPTEHSAQFAKQGPELIGPMTGPIVAYAIDSTINVGIDGSWRTYPRFTALGPLQGLVLSNETTGVMISLSYPLPAGRTITVDLEAGNKSVTLDDGTNLIGYLSQDSDLAEFYLTENNNGNNQLRARASGVNTDTLVTVYWYDRYLGI